MSEPPVLTYQEHASYSNWDAFWILKLKLEVHVLAILNAKPEGGGDHTYLVDEIFGIQYFTNFIYMKMKSC